MNGQKRLRRMRGESEVGTLIGCGVLIVLALVGACALASRDSGEAIEVLEANGFTDGRVLDKSYFAQFHGCSEDDAIAYDCEATNPIGKKVRVTVCTGWWFKGGTIRVRTDR